MSPVHVFFPEAPHWCDICSGEAPSTYKTGSKLMDGAPNTSLVSSHSGIRRTVVISPDQHEKARRFEDFNALSSVQNVLVHLISPVLFPFSNITSEYTYFSSNPYRFTEFELALLLELTVAHRR
jgi:hypothetical protein